MTRSRPLACAVFFAFGLAAVSAQAPPGRKLLSELPLPKAGDKVQVGAAQIKTKAMEGEPGFAEVVEVLEPALGSDDYRVIPAVEWELDVDGWFDDEGLNLTAVYPRSGLWMMRGATGKVQPKVGPIGIERTETKFATRGDIITHVNGVAVKSYDRWVYAVNSAPNKRDIPVVVMDGRTGRKRLLYVTASKLRTG